MKILGIDPGFDRMGWGVLEKERRTIRYVECGVIRTDASKDTASRLSDLAKQLRAILTRVEVNCAAVESLFFFKNQKTVMTVAQARGVILECLCSAGVEVVEFTPLQIKAHVAGSGGADKKAVEKMVRLQIPNIPLKLLDDTLDALAAAFALALTRSS